MNYQKTLAVALGGACVGAGAALLYSKATPIASKREKEFLALQTDAHGRTLHEGSESSYFSDVKDYKLLLTREEIDIGVQRVADEIERRFRGERIVICGILKGAFVFITDLCRRLKRPYSCYFVEASSYTGQSQSDKVELLSRIVPSKFSGRKIVLVDELLDNGHTMHTMLNYLMSELNVPRSDIATCCLFSKQQEDRPKHFDADITGLPNLPNLWLVGYGLDDDGTKRGWTELFAKPKIPGVPKVVADAIFEEGAVGKAKLVELRAELVKTVYRVDL